MSTFANYLVVTSDQIVVTSEGMFVTVDGRGDVARKKWHAPINLIRIE